MTEPSEHGDELACERCGGALPARVVAEILRCPSCGHAQRLGDVERSALAAYQGEAERDLAQAASHREEKRGLAEQQRRMQRTTQIVLAVLTPLVLGTGIAFMGIPLMHALGFFDWNTLEPDTKTAIVVSIFAFSTVVGVAVAIITYVTSRRAARERAEASPDRAPAVAPPVVSIVLCPRCGGPNELHAGVPTEECLFCHGTFAANEAVRAAGLNATERARRSAALDRYRKERMTVAGFASQAEGQGGMPLSGALAVTAGMFGGILCLGSGFGGAQNVTGAETHSWLGVLGGAVVGIVLLAAGVGFGVVAARHLRERSERAVTESRVFGGTPIRGIMATADWLSTHWAGPYELELLQFGSLTYRGAYGDVAGYPWLVEVASGPATPRAQVLVAAFFDAPPDPSRAPDDARDVIAELEQRGAALALSEAGARVRLRPDTATPDVVRHLRERLVFLVTRLGGRPSTFDS